MSKPPYFHVAENSVVMFAEGALQRCPVCQTAQKRRLIYTDKAASAAAAHARCRVAAAATAPALGTSFIDPVAWLWTGVCAVCSSELTRPPLQTWDQAGQPRSQPPAPWALRSVAMSGRGGRHVILQVSLADLAASPSG